MLGQRQPGLGCGYLQVGTGLDAGVALETESGPSEPLSFRLRSPALLTRWPGHRPHTRTVNWLVAVLAAGPEQPRSRLSAPGPGGLPDGWVLCRPAFGPLGGLRARSSCW